MIVEFRHMNAETLMEDAHYIGLRPNKTSDSVSFKFFLWRNLYDVETAIIKRDGEGIGLAWLMKDGEEYFSAMPSCKEEDLEYCFLETVKYFNDTLHKPLKIYLADEEAVEKLKPILTDYTIREEEDYKDYIYDAEALKTLAGKKLHKKKNNVNNFMKTYEGRYEYKRLACSDRDEIITFLSQWREDKDSEMEDMLDSEIVGIHDALKNCGLLDVYMSGVYIDGALKAFTMGSFNRLEKMAIIHIEKADPEVRGLYQYINREFLIDTFPEAELVNREDDQGVEGLRKAKESYYPCMFEKKYYIEQNNYRG